MKRSEMIEILQKEFPAWNDQVELDSYDFHGILDILDKQGMLPPKQENQWPINNPEINENWRIWESE